MEQPHILIEISSLENSLSLPPHRQIQIIFIKISFLKKKKKRKFVRIFVPIFISHPPNLCDIKFDRKSVARIPEQGHARVHERTITTRERKHGDDREREREREREGVHYIRITDVLYVEGEEGGVTLCGSRVREGRPGGGPL